MKSALKFLGPVNAPVIDRPIGTARPVAVASAPDHATVNRDADGGSGSTWIETANADAQRAVEGDSDDDWDAMWNPDDDCAYCGGQGFLEFDDVETDQRVACPECGGRP